MAIKLYFSIFYFFSYSLIQKNIFNFLAWKIAVGVTIPCVFIVIVVLVVIMWLFRKNRLQLNKKKK